MSIHPNPHLRLFLSCGGNSPTEGSRRMSVAGNLAGFQAKPRSEHQGHLQHPKTLIPYHYVKVEFTFARKRPTKFAFEAWVATKNWQYKFEKRITVEKTNGSSHLQLSSNWAVLFLVSEINSCLTWRQTTGLWWSEIIDWQRSTTWSWVTV